MQRLHVDFLIVFHSFGRRMLKIILDSEAVYIDIGVYYIENY